MNSQAWSIETVNPAAANHVVPGSFDILEALRERVTMYLASGTDEKYVLQEAALLRVDHYFAGAVPFEAAFMGNLISAITIQVIGTTGTATRSQILALHEKYYGRS
jgi:hypothetical protein